MMIDGMLFRHGKSITVQRASVTAGGYTGDTVTWGTHLTTTAVIRPTTGNDIIKLQKIGLEADFVLYMKNQDIQEKDRILYNSKYYFVNWVQNPQTADEFLQVYVKGSDSFGANSI